MKALRRELRALAPLLALNGFAVAQPVLDVLGRNPELVVFRGAGRVELWALGLLAVLAVPLALWLVELAVGALSSTARPVVHLGAVGVLAVALAAQLGSRLLGLDGWLLVVLAVAVGAALAAVTTRPLVGLWLAYAAWTPLAFLVLFTVLSPAAEAAGDAGSTVQGGRVADPARVVVLVLDELPLASLLAADGTIDADLYPGFAEMAGGSSWFRSASTVSTATTSAVPALLTGRFPEGNARPLAADHPENLFTLLGGAYGMAVEESLTRLCPTALCETAGGAGPLRVLLEDGARIWREQVGLRSESDPLATFREPGPADAPDHGDGLAQPERFSSFLRSFEGSPEQTLHYAHLVLPHAPSRWLPSGRSYPHPAADLGPFWEEPGRYFDLWIEDGWPALLGRQRAILQTQYVDGLVQAMITQLREAGQWDESLVVVVADHGRAFEPGLPARGLDATADPTAVLPEIMGVPLFVKAPGQSAPAVHDTNVQLIDVVPTIADLLGIDVPWALDGTSALASTPRPTRKTLHQHVFQDGFATAAGPVREVGAEGFFREVLERGVHRLVPRAGPHRVHRIGPGADLVGERFSGGTVSPSSATARLHGAEGLENVDLGAEAVPAFLSGEVRGGTGDIVVVVNGRVAGVSATFDWDGRTGVFAVMVPEDLLVAGANRVELYLRNGSGFRSVRLDEP